jgi:hypothetical protein
MSNLLFIYLMGIIIFCEKEKMLLVFVVAGGGRCFPARLCVGCELVLVPLSFVNSLYSISFFCSFSNININNET